MENNVREEKRYYEIAGKPSIAVLSSGNYMYTHIGIDEIGSPIPIPNPHFSKPPKVLYQKTRVLTTDDAKSKNIKDALTEVATLYFDEKKEHPFALPTGNSRLAISLCGAGMNLENASIYTFLEEIESSEDEFTTYKSLKFRHRYYRYNVWVRKCIYDINQMILKDKFFTEIDEKLKVFKENNYSIDSMMGRDIQISIKRLITWKFIDNGLLAEKYGEIGSDENMVWLNDERAKFNDSRQYEQIKMQISRRKPKTPEEKWFAKFKMGDTFNMFASKEDIAAFNRYYKSYQEV